MRQRFSVDTVQCFLKVYEVGTDCSVFTSCCAVASSASSAGFSMFFGFSPCHLYFPYQALVFLSVVVFRFLWSYSVYLFLGLVPCPIFPLSLFESQDFLSLTLWWKLLSLGSTKTSSRAWNSHKSLWPLLLMLPYRSFRMILSDLHGRFEREDRNLQSHRALKRYNLLNELQ